jgi:protein-tyrosine phosphatase
MISRFICSYFTRRKSAQVLAFVAIAVTSGATASSAAEPRVERLDPKHVVITWTASAPADLYVSDRPDADTSKAQLLSEDDQDGRYVATVTDSRRSYFLISNKVDGSVVRVSERVLPLERASNFRDIGGYAAAGGKHVRWGLIYRSGATPLLSDHDIAYIRALGLHSMIDLRSIEERQLAPTRLAGQGIRYVAIDYSLSHMFRKVSPSEPAAASGYHQPLTSMVPQYRAVFYELISRQGSIAYNCTAGQDRTGIATALILSALGVSRETILQDYHLSTLYRHPENEMPPIDPAKFPDNPLAVFFSTARQAVPSPLYSANGRPLLADVFDEIDTRWGSIENYLDQVLGVDSAELTMLRASYLE